jgi:hypothetical protein
MTLQVEEISTDEGIELCQRLLERSLLLEDLIIKVVAPCTLYFLFQSGLDYSNNKNLRLDKKPLPKPLDLGLLLSTRLLRLCVEGDPHQALLWIHETLSTLPSSNGLETITLCLDSILAPTTLREVEWNMIDFMISGWDAPRLGVASLSFYASEPEPDFSAFFFEKIPRIFLKGILSINDSGHPIYPYGR